MSALKVAIREGADPALNALYAAAFPGEDLAPLVRALLAEPEGVLSLTAHADGVLAGHILFTTCTVDETPVALLGPLAVAPAFQRQGVGGALIRAGLEHLTGAAAHVLVLGDPAYYSRFGFAPAPQVHPPYPLPPAWAEAWRSVALMPGAPPKGRLEVPPPWRDPALWS